MIQQYKKSATDPNTIYTLEDGQLYERAGTSVERLKLEEEIKAISERLAESKTRYEEVKDTKKPISRALEFLICASLSTLLAFVGISCTVLIEGFITKGIPVKEVFKNWETFLSYYKMFDADFPIFSKSLEMTSSFTLHVVSFLLMVTLPIIYAIIKHFHTEEVKDYVDKIVLPKDITELEELLELKMQKLNGLPKIQEERVEEAQDFEELSTLIARIDERETVLQELNALRKELTGETQQPKIASEETGKRFINEPKRANNI